MNSIEIQLPVIAEGEDKSSPFMNCIRKNYRHIRKWAKRTSTNAFRIYDREVPQYPVAIDFYAGRYCIHYFSQKRTSEEPSAELQAAVAEALERLFRATPQQIYWRVRAKSKETRQYEKIGATEQSFTILEYGVKFKVNLVDYLDTGLFLDHRETRQLVASYAKDKRFLNLFAYTCSFTVHAALAGALSSKSVDMSNTYTAWGKENYLLNSISLSDHQVVRADCLKFLDKAFQSGEIYDLIVIDPPTISRSKKMDQLFDIQVDYIPLLEKALALLSSGGILFFSTNSRKFVFDTAHFKSCHISEVTDKTIPIDFRDAKAHRCWKMTKEAVKKYVRRS